MPRRVPCGQIPLCRNEEEMSMKKRLWSILLALTVCMLTLPTQALAMQLRVCYLGSIEITLDAEPTDIAWELRARVWEIAGLPADSPTNVAGLFPDRKGNYTPGVRSPRWYSD